MVNLELIVTHYNETEDIIKPLLDSLLIQRRVDKDSYLVTIVNDGGNRVSEKFLSNYHKSLNIRQIDIEHAGVSSARNAGIDNAIGEYLMFCDCDDCFYHALSLLKVMKIIYERPDIAYSSFLEEVHFDETFDDYLHENDTVFVHGKLFKRKYLLANNLRFDPELFIHEDCYFVSLCKEYTDNSIYCKEPYYLWCSRDDSVCRRDKDYLLKTYVDQIKMQEHLIARFKKDGKLDAAIHATVCFIYNTYYELTKEKWNESEYLEQTNEAMHSFIEKHGDLYTLCTTNKKIEWLNAIRTNAHREGMLFETISFSDWMKTILRR